MPQGPNLNCLTACAASSQAIGEAAELVRRGDADAMLSGGTHSMIHPFGVTGFNLLTAFSTRNDEPTRASRPFDNDRDGFVLGEGRRWSCSRNCEHAKKRGAKIHGELLGYGSTADAYRITDTHPEGRGASSCITSARCRTPALAWATSATSTPTARAPTSNDKVETLAIKTVFGEQAYKIPGVEHEEHDGPPHRRRRATGADRVPAGDPRWHRRRRRSTTRLPTRTVTSTTCRTRPVRRRAITPSPTASGLAGRTSR